MPLKSRGHVVTQVLPKDMSYIPGDAPADWHTQAACRTTAAPNVAEKDWSKEPITDEEHGRRMREDAKYAAWFNGEVAKKRGILPTK